MIVYGFTFTVISFMLEHFIIKQGGGAGGVHLKAQYIIDETYFKSL